MTKFKKIVFSILILSGISISSTQAAEKVIYKIDIKKEINNTTRLYLKNGMEEAISHNADAIIIHMNTYGGYLDVADSMRTAILYSPIPVYAFVDNNAASAGALISIACKGIYMRRGASIGAATVVEQTGEAAPDKYQSYMRSMMRATAESHGKDTIIQGRDTIYKWIRDPKIAEAMVDQRIAIPGLIDSTRTLTFTAEEAVKWGYCDGIAETTNEVITQYLGYNDYEIKSYTPSWMDNLKGFLMNPIFQSILILLIVGGIYFELQTPGIGFPTFIAVAAAVLYFAPLYIEGLALYWEILLFVIGLILIALEIFVVPGFGFTGILGAILIFTGLTVSLIENVDFDFSGVPTGQVGRAIMTVLVGLLAGVIGTIWLSSKIGSKGVLRKLALQTDLETSVSTPSYSSLIGEIGFAMTVLRPSGKVVIQDEIYDGVSELGFIEKGEKVKVVRFENAQVYVEPCND